MEDIARFLSRHVPWSEFPSSGIERVVRNLEILYLPAQETLEFLSLGDRRGLLIVRSGRLRRRLESSSSPEDLLLEGDPLLLGPPDGPPLDALVALEDCLLYRLPEEVLAGLGGNPVFEAWVRWGPMERLARVSSVDLPPPGRAIPGPIVAATGDRPVDPRISWRPAPSVLALTRALVSLEETGRLPEDGAIRPFGGDPAVLHPPMAALLHLWERLSEVSSAERLGIWTEAAVATLVGHRPGSLDECSRTHLLGLVSDAVIRQTLVLAGPARRPESPWAILTTAPCDRCSWTPSAPLLLISRDASEADRSKALDLLSRMDRILEAAFRPKSTSGIPFGSPTRLLDDSQVSRVVSGSLDLIAEWLDARPLAGPLDPRPFRRGLVDRVRSPETLSRFLVRLRLPRGLIHDRVDLPDGRLEETVSLEDLVFRPLRELGRIGALLAGSDSTDTPNRWQDAARCGILPEEMALAAVGGWIFGLRQEIRLGDPDDPLRTDPPGYLRPSVLPPRHRRLLRDLIGAMHRMVGVLETRSRSEGSWRF